MGHNILPPKRGKHEDGKSERLTKSTGGFICLCLVTTQCYECRGRFMMVTVHYPGEAAAITTLGDSTHSTGAQVDILISHTLGAT